MVCREIVQSAGQTIGMGCTIDTDFFNNCFDLEGKVGIHYIFYMINNLDKNCEEFPLYQSPVAVVHCATLEE